MPLGLAAKRDRQRSCLACVARGAPDAPLTKIDDRAESLPDLGMRMAIGQIKAIQARLSRRRKAQRRGHDHADSVARSDDDRRRARSAAVARLLRQAGRSGSARGSEAPVTEGNPIVEEVALVPDDRPGWIERPSDVVETARCRSPRSAWRSTFCTTWSKSIPAARPTGPELKRTTTSRRSGFCLPKIGKMTGEKDIVMKFNETDRGWPTAFWLIQQLRNIRSF